MSESVLEKSTMSKQKKVSYAAGIGFLVIVAVHYAVSHFVDIRYLVNAEVAQKLLDGGHANFIQKPLARLVADHPGMGFVNNILLSQSLLLIPVLIFLAVVCLGKWIKLSDVLHVKKMHWATWFLIPVIWLLCQPGLMWINATSQLVFKNQIGGVIAGTATSLPFPIAVLLIALTPALVEEMTCRGMVYGSLSDDQDPIPAIIISALTFGLMHMNFNQFLYASALGVIMACLVYCSGSIFTSSLLHFLFNSFSVCLLYFITNIFPKLMNWLQNASGVQADGDVISQEAVTNQLTEQMANGADPSQIFLLVIMLFVPGVFGFLLSLGLMYLIAKLNHRDVLIKGLFKKRTPEEAKLFRAERWNDRKIKGRYVNIFLAFAWLCAFVICILAEFGK